MIQLGPRFWCLQRPYRLTVVPWKGRRGYATQTLVGLHQVLLTFDHDNMASRRTIEVNGGVLSGEKSAADAPDGRCSLLYRVPTCQNAAQAPLLRR